MGTIRATVLIAMAAVQTPLSRVLPFCVQPSARLDQLRAGWSSPCAVTHPIAVDRENAHDARHDARMSSVVPGAATAVPASRSSSRHQPPRPQPQLPPLSAPPVVHAVRASILVTKTSATAKLLSQTTKFLSQQLPGRTQEPWDCAGKAPSSSPPSTGDNSVNTTAWTVVARSNQGSIHVDAPVCCSKTSRSCPRAVFDNFLLCVFTVQ